MSAGNVKSSKQSLVNYSLSKQQYIYPQISPRTLKLYVKSSIYVTPGREKKICSVLYKKKISY